MRKSDKIIKLLRGFVASTRSDIILPNFYHGFYEMDLFKLNDRGYITEYEIKISRSDYLNDFKKGKDFYYNKEHSHLKHDKIKSGDGPNRFFFVVPENLIKVEEVPDHCGLIYYCEAGKYQSLRVVKNAKMLHKNKFDKYKGLAHKMSFINENLRIQLARYKKGCASCVDLKARIAELKNDVKVAESNLQFYERALKQTSLT